MIKFVIGLIALIFVALAVYTYTDKKAEVVPKSAVTHEVVKEEVTETKVEKPVEVAKEVHLENDKIVPNSYLLNNKDNELVFGNDDYNPNLNPSSSEVLTSEELEIIEKDMDILSFQSEGNSVDSNLSFVNSQTDLNNNNLSDTKALGGKEISEIENGMDIPIAIYRGKINLEDENLD